MQDYQRPLCAPANSPAYALIQVLTDLGHELVVCLQSCITLSAMATSYLASGALWPERINVTQPQTQSLDAYVQEVCFEAGR